MSFKERYNPPSGTGSALTAGAVAGGIGYGLGTGSIQKGVHKLMDMTPKEVQHDTTEAVSGAAEKVGNQTIGETLTNLKQSITDLLP